MSTICEVLDILKTLAKRADRDRQTPMDWIFRKSHAEKIRFRYDKNNKNVDDGAAKTNNKENKYKKADISVSRDGKLNIHKACMHIEPYQEVGRIMLSCNPAVVKYKKIHLECSGVVIDAKTWKPLAIPPKNFIPNPRANIVTEHLKNDLYDIIRVEDGTIVTLYSWEHPSAGPIWCMTTSNGYDVSPYKWVGEKTYAEMFYDMLNNYYNTNEESSAESAESAESDKFSFELQRGLLGENDVRLKFSGLDTNYCYTIGFHNKTFHPLRCDNDIMGWKIRAFNLINMETEDFPNGAFEKLVTQNKNELQGHEKSYKYIKKLCGDSTISEAELHNCETIDSKWRPCYGYILRSRDRSITGMHSDILIESKLLAKIRRYLYQQPNKYISKYLNENSRFEYKILCSYLTPVNRDDFLRLFPQYEDKYKTYKNFISTLVDEMCNISHQQIFSSKKSKNKESAMVNLAKEVLGYIKKFENINTSASGNKTVLLNYALHPSYALLYMNTMNTMDTGEKPE